MIPFRGPTPLLTVTELLMSARELFDFDFGLQEEVEVGLAESPLPRL